MSARHYFSVLCGPGAVGIFDKLEGEVAQIDGGPVEAQLPNQFTSAYTLCGEVFQLADRVKWDPPGEDALLLYYIALYAMDDEEARRFAETYSKTPLPGYYCSILSRYADYDWGIRLKLFLLMAEHAAELTQFCRNSFIQTRYAQHAL